jgi:hypothetical protein
MTQARARLGRIGRLVLAAVVSGFVAGAVAGLGARLVMFGIRLSNGAFDGASTHAGATNGQWTYQGTLAVILTGAIYGSPGGALYVLVRNGLGPWRALRGLAFGAVLLSVFGAVVLDGSYEFSRFVSPAVSVAAFAALYPLYGIAAAFVADAIAPPRPIAHPRWRVAAAVALGLGGAAGAWQLAGDLRFRYGF